MVKYNKNFDENEGLLRFRNEQFPYYFKIREVIKYLMEEKYKTMKDTMELKWYDVEEDVKLPLNIYTYDSNIDKISDFDLEILKTLNFGQLRITDINKEKNEHSTVKDINEKEGN